MRAYLDWCGERRVDPLAASRPQVELYVRWMQEVRRFKPSTVSRRMSIVAGFYRTAVIGCQLEDSRPNTSIASAGGAQPSAPEVELAAEAEAEGRVEECGDTGEAIMAA